MHLQKSFLRLIMVVTLICMAGSLILRAARSATSLPPVSFAAPQDYKVGTLPFANATADFNGDHILDLAVVNYSSNNVTVLLGKGDGTFGPGVNYAVGTEPSAITAVDLNGDGVPDLAIADEIGKTVAVLINKADGSGRFKPAVLYPAGQAPRGIAAGDLRGSGIIDLVVANNLGGDVTVFLGNGDGTFKPGVNYAAHTNPKSVVLGYFSNNNVLDIAVANHNTNDVSVLMGNGDGTFQAPVNNPVGTDPRHVVAFDFNKDGYVDLATANGGESTVSILYGNGDGTFQPQVKYTANASPRWLAVADYNNDGFLDIATSNYDARGVSVLLGTGSSVAGEAFTAPTNYVVGNNLTGLVAGDFNGDGLPDIAVAIGGLPASPNTAMAILLNDPAMVSPTSVKFPIQVLGTASAVQSVTLSNAAPNSLAISAIAFSGSGAGDYSQINTCGMTLSGNSSCTITITFTPKGINNRNATLTITDSAPGKTQTIAVSGVGTAASFSPNSLTFAAQNVGTSSGPHSITMTNVSTSTAISLTGISISGANASDFAQTHSCAGTLGPNKSCTINVSFKPSATGTRTAALSVTDNAGGGPQPIPLSGTGQ